MRAVLIANIKYEAHKHPNYILPHHCTIQWEEISFNIIVLESDFPLLTACRMVTGQNILYYNNN